MTLFNNWAVVSYKDDTGLGRHAADLKKILKLGYQLVVPSERLSTHPLDATADRVLQPDFTDEQVKNCLTGLDGLIVLERQFHPRLLETAKELGLKIVAVPMWEWFLGNAPEWKFCDLFICQSRFTEQIVRKYGWTNTVRLPLALDLSQFPARLVKNAARVFIHNAGLIDADDRKATRDTIRAFMRTRRSDIQLVVRLQKEADLPEHDERVQVRIGNLEDPGELYQNGDCAIQPSKMEGIGFMVVEPVSVGLPVITLNYPPMNEYVHQPEMLVRPRLFSRKCFATQWIPHAHLRLPDINDLTRKIIWCADNDLSRISQANRQWSEQAFDPDKLKKLWLDAVERIL